MENPFIRLIVAMAVSFGFAIIWLTAVAPDLMPVMVKAMSQSAPTTPTIAAQLASLVAHIFILAFIMLAPVVVALGALRWARGNSG